MVPLEVPVEGLVVGHVGDAAARPLHGLHRDLVQLPGLVQPQLLLHLLQGFGGGRHGLEAAAVQRLHVAKLLQVTLAEQHTHTQSTTLLMGIQMEQAALCLYPLPFGLSKTCMFFSFPQQGDSGWAGNYSPAQLDGS